MKYQLAISDKKFEVEVNAITQGIASVTVNGNAYEVSIENLDAVSPGASAPPAPAQRAAPAPPPVRPKPVAPAAPPAPPAAAAGAGTVTAPIPGRMMSIMVQVGDQVKAGQTLATMEAMKMENNIISNVNGTVQEIRVQKDSEVATGDVIMSIAPA